MKPSFLLSLLVCVGACTVPAFASSAAETELRAQLDAFLDGASRSDREVHDRFWAEDLVYTSSSGRRFGKAAILDGLPPEPASGPARYSAEAVDIRVEGEVAVITFRLVSSGDDGSRETFLNSGVFRKRAGEWRAFAWQATREAVE